MLSVIRGYCLPTYIIMTAHQAQPSHIILPVRQGSYLDKNK